MARLHCESSPQPSHSSHVNQLQSYVHNHRARLGQRDTSSPYVSTPRPTVDQSESAIKQPRWVISCRSNSGLAKQANSGVRAMFHVKHPLWDKQVVAGPPYRDQGSRRTSLQPPSHRMFKGSRSGDISWPGRARRLVKSSVRPGSTRAAQSDPRMDGSHNLGRSLSLSKDPTTCSSNIIHLLAEKRTCFT